MTRQEISGNDVNVQCSVQMGIVGAKYRVRTAPISRAAL